MIGTIKEIIDNNVIVTLKIDIREQPNLVNLHIIFENGDDRVVGEIVNVTLTELKANIVGDIKNNIFTPGSGVKPSFKSTVRLVNMQELELFLGEQNIKNGYTNFGVSNIYKGYKINIGINDFFSNHFSILGNSGSGKSCAVASILQKIFTSSPTPPLNSNFFFFDAYGEYTSAFSKLHEQNPKLNYKVYTTNIEDKENEILKIPVWLLDVDDFALLLNATTPSQLPIIEKMLKLVKILTGTSEVVIKRKNDIIARAVQDILLSGSESTKIRDQVIAVLSKFNTSELNLNSQIIQPGYVRTLKQCLYIDNTGKMQEMELVIEFIRSYIMDNSLEIPESEASKIYTIADLENAMDFTLISEGLLQSDKVFDIANVLSVRLHSLVSGSNSIYFDYPEYVTRDEYIKRLTTNKETGGRCQIVNFNVNYVDDRMAKCLTKIISRMMFIKTSTAVPRGHDAYHIVMEEAHRYVQHDTDADVLGYNIFERITKEGRKYGIFLVLITQRPSELSDVCVSQCSNFLIMRTLHPVDLKYIKQMVPNISEEIVLQLKNLKPGNCIAFGYAFKVPITMYIEMPNPRPLSNNVDLENVWYREIEEPQAPPTNIYQNVNEITFQNNSNEVSGGGKFFNSPIQQTKEVRQPIQVSPESVERTVQMQQPQQVVPQNTLQNFTEQANQTSTISTVSNT